MGLRIGVVGVVGVVGGIAEKAKIARSVIERREA